MATHQEIAGVSDQDLLERMLRSHDDRFNDVFWQLFDQQISPHIGENPVVADLGCGPGLLIRDIAARYSESDPHGFDVTPAMIEYANGLDLSAHFAALDITTSAVPLKDHSVDLLTMAAVLHVLDEPLKCLAELRRLLKPNGRFLLVDWVRQPLYKYLVMMMENVPPERAEQMEKAVLRLSVAHSKYTIDDWVWLLGKGGFEVTHHEQTRSDHFRTFVCKPSDLAT